MKNCLEKELSLLLIIALICMLCGCSKVEPDNQGNIQKEYILNIRSRKIHAPSCFYVERMREQNKKSTQDTLLHLVQEGYVICRKCRAGITKKDKSEKIDRKNYPNLYVEDVVELSTLENYHDAISEMGEWYVNHIPTYAGRIQEEELTKYKGTLTEYREYKLNGKKYNVLTEDKALPMSELEQDTLITRGTESAIQYYEEEYESIKFKSRIAYYPCDLLKDCMDYNMPGDDCTRYMFAVLNRMDNKFTEKYKKLTRTEYSKTNSEALATDVKDIAFGMISLGFQLFGSEEKIVDVNSDTIPEGYILRMNDDFSLQKGDILARPGHVHIYLGDGKCISAENFGWGRVYREFPQIYDIQVKKVDGKNIIALTNSTNEDEYYPRVYRYAGRAEE